MLLLDQLFGAELMWTRGRDPDARPVPDRGRRRGRPVDAVLELRAQLAEGQNRLRSLRRRVLLGRHAGGAALLRGVPLGELPSRVTGISVGEPAAAPRRTIASPCSRRASRAAAGVRALVHEPALFKVAAP